MPSDAELCLECADAFDRLSGSRGEARGDLALNLRGIHLHRAGRGELLTLEAPRDEGLIWRYQLYR